MEKAEARSKTSQFASFCSQEVSSNAHGIFAYKNFLSVRICSPAAVRTVAGINVPALYSAKLYFTDYRSFLRDLVVLYVFRPRETTSLNC